MTDSAFSRPTRLTTQKEQPRCEKPRGKFFCAFQSARVSEESQKIECPEREEASKDAGDVLLKRGKFRHVKCLKDAECDTSGGRVVATSEVGSGR